MLQLVQPPKHQRRSTCRCWPTGRKIKEESILHEPPTLRHSPTAPVSTTFENAEIPFTPVAKVGDILPGQGQAYAVAGRMVAIFNENGKYFAIDDFCPHMGASLAGGHLEDGEVTCPWHAWRFCIHDGRWCDNPKVKVD